MSLSNILKPTHAVASAPISLLRGGATSSRIIKQGITPIDWNAKPFTTQMPEHKNMQSTLPDESEPNQELESAEVSETRRLAHLQQQELEEGRKQAQRQAQIILDQAQEQAKKIVEQAQAEAETLYQKAQEDGFAQGLSAGTQEGTSKAKEDFLEEALPQKQQLAELLQWLADYRNTYVAEFEQEMRELMSAMVLKVIQREMTGSPDTLLGMLQKAVKDNQREEWIKITISGDLLEQVAVSTEEITKALIGVNPNIMVESVKSGQGQILLETPKGYTDISPEAQVENLRQAMDAAISSN